MAMKKFTDSPSTVGLFANKMPWGNDRLNLHLLEHAIAAYNSDSEAARASGYSAATTIDRGAVEISIAGHQNATVVAARGTDSFADVLHDISATWRIGWTPPLPRRVIDPLDPLKLENFGRPRLGFGFRKQAKKAALAVHKAVNDIGSQIRRAHRGRPWHQRIYVTGHSLGGPVALALAAYLDKYRHEDQSIAGCVLFEPPRPGNEALARWAINTFRIATVAHAIRGEIDLITRYPPSAIGAWHAGPVVIYDRDSSARMRADAWRIHRRAHRVPRWRFITRRRIALRAHKAVQLRQTILKVIEEQKGGP